MFEDFLETPGKADPAAVVIDMRNERSPQHRGIADCSLRIADFGHPIAIGHKFAIRIPQFAIGEAWATRTREIPFELPAEAIRIGFITADTRWFPDRTGQALTIARPIQVQG